MFGVPRRKVASFEKRVNKLGTAQGKIDLLWKGTLLIEHKSLGRDLGKALQQALDYFPGLTPEELPRYVLVRDFEHFELLDLEPDQPDQVGQAVHKFTLPELADNIQRFAFVAGYRTQHSKDLTSSTSRLWSPSASCMTPSSATTTPAKSLRCFWCHIPNRDCA